MLKIKRGGRTLLSDSKSMRGFSIMEILVALTIMSIVAMGMATLITNQMSDIKGIDEKMSLQGVQSQVMNVLTSAAFCRCFMDPTRTFNYAATPQAWNGFPTSIASAYDGTCTALGAPFLTVGVPLSGNLKPIGMAMEDIIETTVGSGNFSANLVLKFDPTLLTRQRKNLKMPMYFTVDMLGPPAAKPFVSCSSAASSTIDLPTLCAQMNGFYNGTTCEPTYQ